MRQHCVAREDLEAQDILRVNCVKNGYDTNYNPTQSNIPRSGELSNKLNAVVHAHTANLSQECAVCVKSKNEQSHSDVLSFDNLLLTNFGVSTDTKCIQTDQALLSNIAIQTDLPSLVNIAIQTDLPTLVNIAIQTDTDQPSLANIAIQTDSDQPSLLNIAT
ncbi:unnamed protein product [Orchesella dallaii]|uniref:Uncharacterized protein n=1 Tax=Orchesella dallaii TaxID=48710 RepID=A0ABP1PWZ3_9HEXA